jgi:(S)-ureidoglycine-glyoxylate aminotransferase
MTEIFDELNPPPRLLMGPGPINADPRVLRAASMPLLGQFDPHFTEYMNETMALLRQLFQTRCHWAFVVNGTARAGIEAILTSIIAPGDRVVVPVFGRFGQLLCEIAERCRAEVCPIETDWGGVFTPERIEDAIAKHDPRVVATVHGDTSTTMAQPLADIGEICRRRGIFLYVDATATLGGMDVPMDDWQIDAMSGGLQKCLSGPPGSAPVAFNDRIADHVLSRKHIEQGIRPEGFNPGAGEMIQSNYFDLPMLMDYWSESRLNHHTEATSMLYAARECARIALGEGLAARFRRHSVVSRAVVAGITAMGLKPFGDQDHKMANITGIEIPDGVDGDAVIRGMYRNFAIEIGTSFGPLRGRIWRIGAMGYNARRDSVLTTLAALEATLRDNGFTPPPGAGVDAALAEFRIEEDAAS